MKYKIVVFCLIISQIAYSQNDISVKERLKSRLFSNANWENIITMGDLNMEGNNGMTWRNQSHTYMISIDFELNTANDIGVKVLLKTNSNQEVIVGYNLNNEQLYINNTNAGKTDSIGVFTAPMHLERGRIKLQIFVDETTVEVFGNDGNALVFAKVFPEGNSFDWEIFSNGKVKIAQLSVFEKKQ